MSQSHLFSQHVLARAWLGQWALVDPHDPTRDRYWLSVDPLSSSSLRGVQYVRLIRVHLIFSQPLSGCLFVIRDDARVTLPSYLSFPVLPVPGVPTPLVFNLFPSSVPFSAVYFSASSPLPVCLELPLDLKLRSTDSLVIGIAIPITEWASGNNVVCTYMVSLQCTF